MYMSHNTVILFSKCDVKQPFWVIQPRVQTVVIILVLNML